MKKTIIITSIIAVIIVAFVIWRAQWKKKDIQKTVDYLKNSTTNNRE